jgi:putative transposase
MLKRVLHEIEDEKGFEIKQMETSEDHIHLFVSAPPHVSISTLVKWLKGISARRILKANPSLQKQLYRGHLWNPSYYVGTAGDMSEEVIRKYIESQKSEAGKNAKA